MAAVLGTLSGFSRAASTPCTRRLSRASPARACERAPPTPAPRADRIDDDVEDARHVAERHPVGVRQRPVRVLRVDEEERVRLDARLELFDGRRRIGDAELEEEARDGGGSRRGGRRGGYSMGGG